MKAKFTILLSAFSALTFAQETISFEASEGFNIGTLHNQNGWEVTEGPDGVLEKQIISDEQASDGDFSFKNAFEDGYDFQWLPIFGAAYTFENPFDYYYFTISYDIMPTEQQGSDFEFTLFAVNEEEDFTPVAGVGVENRGYFYFITDEDYGFEYSENDPTWEPNEWVNIKIEVTEESINYYVNDNLEKSIPNFSQLNVFGFNILHNNYGGDAYYDNIVISTEEAGLEDMNMSDIKVYPNPAKNMVTVSSVNPQDIKSVDIYNLIGQKVIEQINTENIDISELSAGTYIIKITTSDDKTISRKVVKN